MAYNKLLHDKSLHNTLHCALMLLAFFFSHSLIHAQERETTPGLRIENRSSVFRTQEGFKINQTITFPSVADVLRYEIELEQVFENRTDLILKLETRDPFFEVSLAAGSYRYRYTAINRMNMVEGRSAWQNFEILPAIVPSIESYQPFYSLLFDTKDTERVITVHGSGLSDKTEFALIKYSGNFNWTDVNMENRSDAVFPIKVELEEDKAHLTFTRESVKRGVYEIFSRNPGGLWQSFGKVNAKYLNGSDLSISFGYTPIVEYGFALGYNAAIDWFPIKTKIGNFGFGFQAFFRDFNQIDDDDDNNNDNDNDRGSYTDLIGSLNLLYQLQSSERLYHNFRFGLLPVWTEVSRQNNETTSYKTEIFMNINIGYSIQYFIWKNLFVKAGIDLYLVNNINHPENQTPPAGQYTVLDVSRSFIFRPGISIGWQFGRWAEMAEVAEAARRGQDYSVPVKEPPRSENLISIGWSPMILLYGIDKEGKNNSGDYEALGGFNPLGMNFNFVYFPYRWGNNKLGFGLDLATLERKNRSRLKDSPGLSDFIMHIDFLSHFMFGVYYQRIMGENWQIGINTGFGISNPYNYAFQGLPLAMNLGVLVQYFFYKNFYVGLGLNSVSIFNSYYDDDTEKDIRRIGNVLRPSLTVGIQFRRDNETGLRLPGTGLPF